MIRLIVSDLDGTLLPYGEHAVSEAVKGLISSALEQGITVAVSSGRTLGELLSFFPEFWERLYFICCDGAYYGKGKTVFYEKQIARQDLLLLSKTCEGMILHGAHQNYALGAIPESLQGEVSARLTSVDHLSEKIFKVTAFTAPKRLPPYCGLRLHWDGGRGIAQYVNRFSDKGVALSDLQSRLILTKFETACIGDAGNDVAMMHNAKLSFCVGDGCPELTRVCNHTVARAEEALEMLITK